MTATEYEQQAHRTIAGHAAENITYLGFGLVAEVGELADKIAKAVRRGDIVAALSASPVASQTNSATSFGSSQCSPSGSDIVSRT